jgi:hypothetical protein
MNVLTAAGVNGSNRTILSGLLFEFRSHGDTICETIHPYHG